MLASGERFLIRLDGTSDTEKSSPVRGETKKEDPDGVSIWHKCSRTLHQMIGEGSPRTDRIFACTKAEVMANHIYC